MMMVSNSTGVNLPRRPCLRRRWWVRSIQCTMAARSSSLVAQDWRSRTLFCSSEKTLYMAALSPHAPTLPMDPISP